MSAAQHTPGPWELRPDHMGGTSSFIYPLDQQFPVAVVTGYHAGVAQCLPNARLIAAAPELLTALQDCMLVMARELGGLRVIQPELTQARAAIAKATGEAS